MFSEHLISFLTPAEWRGSYLCCPQHFLQHMKLICPARSWYRLLRLYDVLIPRYRTCIRVLFMTVLIHNYNVKAISLQPLVNHNRHIYTHWLGSLFSDMYRQCDDHYVSAPSPNLEVQNFPLFESGAANYELRMVSGTSPSILRDRNNSENADHERDSTNDCWIHFSNLHAVVPLYFHLPRLRGVLASRYINVSQDQLITALVHRYQGDFSPNAC